MGPQSLSLPPQRYEAQGAAELSPGAGSEDHTTATGGGRGRGLAEAPALRGSRASGQPLGHPPSAHELGLQAHPGSPAGHW